MNEVATGVPPGTYILRKKFADVDSWDITVDGEACEAALSLRLVECLREVSRKGRATG